MNIHIYLGSLLAILFFSLQAAPLPQGPHYLFYPTSQAAVWVAPEDEAVGTAVRLLAPQNGSIVSLLQDVQRHFLLMRPREQRIAAYADKDQRLQLASQGYQPKNITLEWQQEGTLQDVKVVIAENDQFRHAVAIRPTEETPSSVILRNLKIATTYYWKVVYSDGDRCVSSPSFSFTTEAIAPRLMTFRGVPNVRDLGGRIGLNGKHIRQGMIYRAGGLNDNASRILLPYEEAIVRKPKLKPLYDDFQLQQKELQEAMDHADTAHYLPLTLSTSWTAFFPKRKITMEDCRQFFELDEIPEEFHGAAATAIAETDTALTFGTPQKHKSVLLLQAIEAPEDGFIQIGLKANSFWGIAVNHKIIENHIATRDDVVPASSDNYIVDLPLRKGRNLVMAAVISSEQAWSFRHSVPTSRLPRREVLQAKQTLLQQKMAKALKVFDDKRNPGKNRLDDETARYLTQTLGIRTEIDLRSDGECYGMTGSPMGASAQWLHIPFKAYKGISTDTGKEAFIKVFNCFLDEANYPVVFHCISGQDRTGTVAFILNGLLGAEEEELFLDWEASGFRNTDPNFCHKRLFLPLVDVFLPLTGQNLTEKIEQYVLSCGFSREDIETFRRIMLE